MTKIKKAAEYEKWYPYEKGTMPEDFGNIDENTTLITVNNCDTYEINWRDTYNNLWLGGGTAGRIVAWKMLKLYSGND